MTGAAFRFGSSAAPPRTAPLPREFADKECPFRASRLLNAKDSEVTMEKSEQPGPLDGVRVLDLGHYIAIPILTRIDIE